MGNGGGSNFGYGLMAENQLGLARRRCSESEGRQISVGAAGAALKNAEPDFALGWFGRIDEARATFGVVEQQSPH
jgi:hypothetical protein